MRLITIALLFSFTTAMAAESKKPEALAVDSACSAEGQTAGCGSEKVGTGLLKCIHTYRRSHKDFTVSSGCKDALKSLHSARASRSTMKK